MTKGPVTMFIGGEISAPEKSNGDGRRCEGEEGGLRENRARSSKGANETF